MSITQELHITAPKRIFNHLQGSFNFDICYIGSFESNILIAYVDLDYVKDVNDHKSHSSYCLVLNNDPITWFSHKQLCVATSITKNEYVVASFMSHEVQ